FWLTTVQVILPCQPGAQEDPSFFDSPESTAVLGMRDNACSTLPSVVTYMVVFRLPPAFSGKVVPPEREQVVVPIEREDTKFVPERVRHLVATMAGLSPNRVDVIAAVFNVTKGAMARAYRDEMGDGFVFASI